VVSGSEGDVPYAEGNVSWMQTANWLVRRSSRPATGTRRTGSFGHDEQKAHEADYITVAVFIVLVIVVVFDVVDFFDVHVCGNDVVVVIVV
jgi:hypothetical protein